MQKTEQIEISGAIAKELGKIPRWKMMLYLQENGESEAYRIAKDLQWTTGKAHSIIKALEKSGAVKTRNEIKNGRAVKLARLVE